MTTSKKTSSTKQTSSTKAQGTCKDPSGGKYAFSADGHLLKGNPHEGPVAWAGYISFDHGIINGNDTVNYADDSPVERTFTGTYRVGSNCEVLVDFSFTLNDPHATAASASLYFANAMKEFRMVQKDEFRVCSGSGIKV